MTRKTFLGMVMALFAGGASAGGEAMDISRDDMKKGLADGSIALVDVRERDEFAAGHIKGAVNMPLSSFDPSKLPADGRTVVVMCRSGNRSGKAQGMASAAGRKTLNYRGSMLEWTAAKEPVVTGP